MERTEDSSEHMSAAESSVLRKAGRLLGSIYLVSGALGALTFLAASIALLKAVEGDAAGYTPPIVKIIERVAGSPSWGELLVKACCKTLLRNP